ncbi:hypothetical protein B9G98_00424 [Wickerhamiella sorbophila]|uniref:Kinetochore-associated protein MTW1 n=1 Tax=Wickerhamiella sorbophila TaxID=45607 RepID=A0A2T0FCS5_9ASCO|nr:hypothetical protein B9G98_00424 [Wickerhamiella sorbophila]PRT52804.1 hypothetical protein B9G98_00424 [Wickerhamiella sorbophila]
MDSAPTEFLKANAILAQVFGHTLTHLIELVRQIMMGVFKSIAAGLEQTLGRINQQRYGGQLGLELKQGLQEYKSTYAKAIVRVIDRIEAYATRNVFKLDESLVDEGYFRLEPFSQIDYSRSGRQLDAEITESEQSLADEIAALQQTRLLNAQIDRCLSSADRLANAQPEAVPDVSELEPLAQQLRNLTHSLKTAPPPAHSVDQEFLQSILWAS